jgi:hypothetical protein
VMLTLLVVPAPGAQAAARPEPTELWRQFPLDTEHSTPQAPAGRESAPPSSAPTSGSTREDRRDGSLLTTQVAAIVLAMAIVLMLATGALAYATRGPFALRYDGRRRRLNGSFREVGDALRAAWSSGRQVAIRSWAHGQGKRAAAEVHAMRETAADLRARLLSEVGTLKVKLHPLAVPTDNESKVNEVGTLEGRLEMYSARGKDRTVHDEPESLKAKINTHRSPAKSVHSAAQAEVETLKEKLAVQHAQSDSASRDGLQTLKEKLDVDPAPIKPASMTRSELETLRAKHGAHLASLNGERGTMTIGDAPSREPDERDTPSKVPGKMPTDAVRQNTTFSLSDAPATSIDLHALAEPPIVSATDSEFPTARRALALPDRSIHRSHLVVIGSNVLQLALLLLIIALLLLNIAVLFDLGVVS